MIDQILRDLSHLAYVLAFAISLMAAVKAWARMIVTDDDSTRAEVRVVFYTAATTWFLCRIVATLIEGGWGR